MLRKLSVFIWLTVAACAAGISAQQTPESKPAPRAETEKRFNFSFGDG